MQEKKGRTQVMACTGTPPQTQMGQMGGGGGCNGVPPPPTVRSLLLITTRSDWKSVNMSVYQAAPGPVGPELKAYPYAA